MVDQALPLVVITGVSGYVGANVTKAFLEDGSFRVRGTVRSTTNEAKIAPLRKAFGDNFAKLELVEADLLNEQSIIDAAEGATYLVHTASPFIIGVAKDDEDSLIKPAVEGTLAACRAASKHGVKRLVVTSSVAAILGVQPTPDVHTEEHWPKPEDQSPYSKSKTLAELAVWDYVKALPEAERFEVATVNPCLVMGPVLTTAPGTSIDTLKGLLTGALETAPGWRPGIVDVRDVAKAHLQAVKVPEAAGNRHICQKQTIHWSEVAAFLKEAFEAKGFKNITSKFQDEAAMSNPVCSAKRAETVLGIEFHDMKDTIIDMAQSFIDLEMVKAE